MSRVVVVGGGPVGLWTAAELQFRGVDVTVLEQLDEPNASAKGFTVHPRTMELWACRGLDERIIKLGRPVPSRHFGLLGRRVDFSGLDSPFPYTLWLAQRKVEAALEEYARDLGVEIRRGSQFIALGQYDETMLAHVVHSTGTSLFEAEYVVGCDGSRSTVRELAGIGFRGTDSTRLADTYRRGRVLLAGDAAHRLLPSSGVGLDVGLQDAWNLGWKLAATVSGWAPDGLLDTYQRERRPVGAALIESTEERSVRRCDFSPAEVALSSLVTDVSDFPEHLAELTSGLSVAYPPDAHTVAAADQDAHRLVGHRAPNLRFAEGPDLFTLLRSGHHVLLEFTGGLVADAVYADLRERRGEPGLVVCCDSLAEERADWTDVTAALIRPDGHVAWVSTEPDPGLSSAATVRAVRGIHR
jgi:2-polyprenyl-6-methoxyphenol hydroxylase-like FAD-dependent oxidoreductase